MGTSGQTLFSPGRPPGYSTAPGLSYPRGTMAGMVTVEDVRAIARALPRTEEYVLRGRLKYRVGRIVYLALSADEAELGFAFPKVERDGLIASAPATFFLPRPADLRYNWVEARLAALDPDELREIIVDAWRMVVPKRLGAAIP